MQAPRRRTAAATELHAGRGHVCDAAAGIITAYGDRWRHFRWDYAPGSKPEVYDAGHDPVIGWRPAPSPEPAAAL